MEFKDKFIAFVDVLGWTKLVKDAEAGAGLPLADLLKLLECLGSGQERERFERNGPACCPLAAYQEKNIDFRLTQISDCAIVSAEISPAGVINLLWHCWRAVIQLLEHGIMCRGYIRRGPVYHTEKHLLGSGYQEAYVAERGVDAFRREADERGTPFVQVDASVTEFIGTCGDACVTEMFSRIVRREGDTVALFPFQRLAHSFLVAGPGYTFDAERQRQSNNNLRKRIKRYKEGVESQVDHSNDDAVRKARHYIAALDAQLVVCDDTEKVINKFDSPRQKRGGS